MAFITTVEVFPTLFLGGAMGICFFSCQLSAFGTPYVAEADALISIVTICWLSGLGILVIFRLIKKD